MSTNPEAMAAEINDLNIMLDRAERDRDNLLGELEVLQAQVSMWKGACEGMLERRGVPPELDNNVTDYTMCCGDPASHRMNSIEVEYADDKVIIRFGNTEIALDAIKAEELAEQLIMAAGAARTVEDEHEQT